nr:chorismate mutase [Burkholderiaceae bacterium]
MDESLKPLRDAIDAIDGQLVDLLAERALLAQRVGQVKAAQGAMVYRPDREAEVLRAVAARNPGPLSAAAV